MNFDFNPSRRISSFNHTIEKPNPPNQIVTERGRYSRKKKVSNVSPTARMMLPRSSGQNSARRGETTERL